LPVICGDIVFIGSCDSNLYALNKTRGVVYFGSGDHHIYAVDAKSGKHVWKFLTGGIVHAAPTLTAENVVFILVPQMVLSMR